MSDSDEGEGYEVADSTKLRGCRLFRVWSLRVRRHHWRGASIFSFPCREQSKSLRERKSKKYHHMSKTLQCFGVNKYISPYIMHYFTCPNLYITSGHFTFKSFTLILGLKDRFCDSFARHSFQILVVMDTTIYTGLIMATDSLTQILMLQPRFQSPAHTCETVQI
jgi:hypothetical protein